ncbi:hypothetical protein HYU19_02550 [Candidatus Woesearchaeota archaeon]|nr:hypothetical protein [Candidatus Woesearchaeota archaeon]
MFPTGAIGTLIVDRVGYSTGVLDYFSPTAEGGELTLSLDRKIEKNIVLLKRNINKVYHPQVFDYHTERAARTGSSGASGGFGTGLAASLQTYSIGSSIVRFFQQLLPGAVGNGATGKGSSSGSSAADSAGAASFAVCGNGVQETEEACDDGNIEWGDGCPGDCRGLQLPSHWVLATSGDRLGMNEEAFIILEKKKENPFEAPFIQVIHYADGDLDRPFQILPGRYKMTAMLLGNNLDIAIPEREQCAILGVIGCTTIPRTVLAGEGRQLPTRLELEQIDEIRTSPEWQEGADEYEQLRESGTLDEMSGTFLKGYYQMDVEIGQEIYGSGAMVFSLLNFNIENVPEQYRQIEDLQVMGGLQSYVEQQPYLFRPSLMTRTSSGHGGAVS